MSLVIFFSKISRSNSDRIDKIEKKKVETWIFVIVNVCVLCVFVCFCCVFMYEWCWLDSGNGNVFGWNVNAYRVFVFKKNGKKEKIDFHDD